MGSILDIRYAELRFTARVISDSTLPETKSSAIRGGMGNMLLDEYCVREQFRKESKDNCKECDFYDECTVQRIMYSHMDIVPSFMSQGEGVGYIVECLDRKTHYKAGDEFRFSLILFGKACVYLSQYLSAIYRLGIKGLGKDEAQFEIAEIRNQRNENILEDGSIYKEKYRIETLDNYVDWRLNKLDITNKIHISFKTPVAIKKEGKILEELDAESFINNLNRRIYMFNCYEGRDISEKIFDGVLNEVRLLAAEYNSKDVKRYSNRKRQTIKLGGIVGNMVLDISGVSDKEGLLRKLLAGEIIHVGSNTRFGFGGYEVNSL